MPSAVRSGETLRIEEASDVAVAILEVSQAGTVWKQQFKNVRSIALPVRDANDNPLPDGIYRYEVTLFPTAPHAGSTRSAGTYRIRFGAVDSTSTPFAAKIGTEQTFNENLYVTGRTCLGGGCSGGEVFVNEDLQVSSAYPWVLFDDVNTAGSGSPYHDWQLMIGDIGSSGTIERFSIQDATANTIPFTIQGSAPNDSLFVAADGKVGLGTSVPDAALDINGSDITLVTGPYWEWRIKGGTEFTITNEGYYGLNAVPFRIGAHPDRAAVAQHERVVRRVLPARSELMFAF